MQMRSAGSSRNCSNTLLSRRLAARSMAFAFGRSSVTSRTAPSTAVRTPPEELWVRSDIAVLLRQADQGIHGHRARAGWPHDDGIDIELGQGLEISLGIARAGEGSLYQRRHVAGRLATEARQ